MTETGAPATPPPVSPRPAGPPGVSAAVLLIGLGRVVREQVEDVLGEHGLSLRHISALGHLGRAPGLSYSELARRAGITAQSMQATLRQLEERGAVVRRSEPGRGRTAELHLTETGTTLLELGRRAFTAADERLLGALPDGHRREFLATLQATFAAAHERT